jgi:hypothetical protein
VVRVRLGVPDAPAELVTPVVSQQIAAVSAENVYLFDRTASTISAIPVTGGTARVVATGNGIRAVVAGGYLYFSRAGASTNEIARIPAGGGEPETVVANVIPSSLAVDGSDLYFTTGRSGLYQATIGGPTVPRLLMRSSPVRDIDDLWVEGSRVHWSSNWSVFGWVARDGSSCANVVETSFSASAAPLGSDLYVSGPEGIYRIPVP